jgi:hypothetical protein
MPIAAAIAHRIHVCTQSAQHPHHQVPPQADIAQPNSTPPPLLTARRPTGGNIPDRSKNFNWAPCSARAGCCENEQEAAERAELEAARGAAEQEAALSEGSSWAGGCMR